MFLTHALRAIYRTVVATTDPFFKYVSLLLTGNSPVDTFVTDASTNNFAVSIVGDTKPNNFNPFTPGRFSNFFDGSGDYLSVADNAAFEVGSGDFTLEGWFYGTAASAGDNLIVAKCSAAYAPYWVSFNAGNSIQFCASSANSGWDVANNVPFGSPTLNSWNHFAVSRSGSSIRLFLNGVLGATVTSSSPLTDHASPFTVGSQFNGANPFTGFISNVRLVKGTAVYTAAFTPSTTPLTAITNTSLLTCQSTRLIDASANAFTITANGDVAFRTFNPFIPDPTASTYGSAFFDGTGDYLSFNSSTSCAFGTSDFTVEFWLYPQNNNVNVMDVRTTQAAVPWGIDLTSGNIPSWYNGSSNNGSTAISQQSWSHVVFCRQGTTHRIFLNGVQTYSWTDSTNYGTMSSAGRIGASQSDVRYFSGYISNLRIVKGTAVYTAAFTPPAAPLTAITNTSLLTLQTNQAINNNLFIDDSTNNFAVTRVGNTTQGTFTPYGSNWSNYFDGTGDYLSVANNAAFNLGTTFTIEFWFYRTATQAMRIVSRQDSTAPYNGFNIGYGELANTWIFDASGTSITFADGGLINQWVHYAWVVNGTSGLVYRNGVAMTAAATQTGQTPSTNTTLFVGMRDNSSAFCSGYISNLRIVKGTAVYTAAFTPPTAPLTAIANTSLLTCQSNRFRDVSTNNFAITKNGDVSVQRFSPFSPSAAYSLSTIGGSAYFDGTDNLVIASNTALTLSGDYTVEAWIYVPSGGTNSPLRVFLNNPGTSPTGYWFLFVNGAQLNFQMYNADVGVLPNVGAYKKDSWVHFAASRSGATTRIFVDGTQTYSYAGSTSFTNNGWYIGGGPDVEFFKGYIANHRVIKGTALYTAAFTPPTAPVTATSNTQLLLNFTDAGVVDNAMMNNIETFGDARVSRAVSKFGSGAMSFAGGSDYLPVPSNVNLELGSGDFTIEAWIYLNARVSSSAIVSKGGNGAYLIFMGAGGELAFYASTNGSSWTTANLTISTLPSLSTWHHIAVVRSGNAVSTYFNGTFVQNAAMTGSLISQPSVPLLIGRYTDSMNGYIDDLRITKGVARYTANFTPPTAALPTS